MTYVTSDLHGYPLDKFLELLSKTGFTKKDTLYVIGDVIDRCGDGGVQMLEWLISTPNAHLLLGNHENMMLACEFLFDDLQDIDTDKLNLEPYYLWLYNGGQVTIDSLKTRHHAKVRRIFEYLRSAPLYKFISDENSRFFILVHGGLKNFNEDLELSEYSRRDLLWHRPEITERYSEFAYTICGHTPVQYYGIEPPRVLRTDTWADIDMGVPSSGTPVIVRLEDMQEFYG